MRLRIAAYRGKWTAVFYVGGKRQRRSLGNIDATRENRPLAERALRDVERQLASPAGDAIQDIFPAYMADSQAIRKDRQWTSWEALKWHFGPLRPADINRDVCRAYTAKRREDGRGDGTIRKELSDLRAAVNWHDKANKAVFDLPAPPDPRDRWLTRDEFTKLLEAAQGTFHLTVFLHLAIATAGRKEALLTMTWPQVRWDRDEIWLGHKPNGKKRPTVPMTRTLKAVLQKAREAARTEFVVEYADKPVADIKTSWRKALRRSGIPPCTIHDLRHTAAVWMAGGGVPLHKISDYLGHSDIRVTQRVYARHQPEHMRDAADALEL